MLREQMRKCRPVITQKCKRLVAQQKTLYKKPQGRGINQLSHNQHYLRQKRQQLQLTGTVI